MKAFIKKSCIEVKHPRDINRICDYLLKNGILNISIDAVELLYSDFSETMLFKSWAPVEKSLLSAFADWLSNIEISTDSDSLFIYNIKNN